VIEDGVYSLIVDGHSHEVAVREDKKGFTIEIGAHAIPVKLEDPFKAKSASGKGGLEGEAVIASPMPGRVVGLKVDVGQTVKEGDGVVLVEAMKMENELHAPKEGKVKSILVKVGDAVEGGQDLVVIE
jgi:biotin carboxyl carrier protein